MQVLASICVGYLLSMLMLAARGSPRAAMNHYPPRQEPAVSINGLTTITPSQSIVSVHPLSFITPGPSPVSVHPLTTVSSTPPPVSVLPLTLVSLPNSDHPFTTLIPVLPSVTSGQETASASSSHKTASSVGIAVGTVIGVLAALIAVIILLFRHRIRKRRQRTRLWHRYAVRRWYKLEEARGFGGMKTDDGSSFRGLRSSLAPSSLYNDSKDPFAGSHCNGTEFVPPTTPHPYSVAPLLIHDARHPSLSTNQYSSTRMPGGVAQNCTRNNSSHARTDSMSYLDMGFPTPTESPTSADPLEQGMEKYQRETLAGDFH